MLAKKGRKEIEVVIRGLNKESLNCRGGGVESRGRK